MTKFKDVFYKHKIYKHIEDQILGSQKWKTHETATDLAENLFNPTRLRGGGNLTPLLFDLE